MYNSPLCDPKLEEFGFVKIDDSMWATNSCTVRIEPDSMMLIEREIVTWQDGYVAHWGADKVYRGTPLPASALEALLLANGLTKTDIN